MPHTSSQTFLRELDKKAERRHSCRQPIAMATGMSPLPNLAGLAPAQPLGDAGLIDLIATIPFQNLKRNLSRHSETTPDAKSIVSLIVEIIEPYQGRVYDPAMGSGGFFVGDTRPSGVRFAKRCRASARGVVQSERFIEEHGGTIGDIMVFGQDQWARGAHLRRAQRARRVRLRRKQPNQSNPTTWRLAAMNMAIRGIDFDFGKEPADTFTRDQHPDLRADFVMANPPFNIKEWWDGKLEGDAQWKLSGTESISIF